MSSNIIDNNPPLNISNHQEQKSDPIPPSWIMKKFLAIRNKINSIREWTAAYSLFDIIKSIFKREPLKPPIHPPQIERFPTGAIAQRITLPQQGEPDSHGHVKDREIIRSWACMELIKQADFVLDNLDPQHKVENSMYHNSLIEGLSTLKNTLKLQSSHTLDPTPWNALPIKNMIASLSASIKGLSNNDKKAVVDTTSRLSYIITLCSDLEQLDQTIQDTTPTTTINEHLNNATIETFDDFVRLAHKIHNVQIQTEDRPKEMSTQRDLLTILLYTHMLPLEFGNKIPSKVSSPLKALMQTYTAKVIQTRERTNLLNGLKLSAKPVIPEDDIEDLAKEQDRVLQQESLLLQDDSNYKNINLEDMHSLKDIQTWIETARTSCRKLITNNISEQQKLKRKIELLKSQAVTEACEPILQHLRDHNAPLEKIQNAEQWMSTLQNAAFFKEIPT